MAYLECAVSAKTVIVHTVQKLQRGSKSGGIYEAGIEKYWKSAECHSRN